MHREHKSRFLGTVKKVVVKVGSSVVTTTSGVHRERVGRIAAELARLHQDGYQVVVVTSGARAAGLARLGLDSIPSKIAEQQAAAAIGQIGLMALYERFFSDHGKHIGQVLVTAADMQDRTRYLNAKHTCDHLLKHGIIPVINENDSVAIDELKFGDNDRLSALVAGLIGADLLILLTDVDGLHASDPRDGQAPLVDVVEDIDQVLREVGVGGPGVLGSGGMASKLRAASSACHRGIPAVIASGLEPGVLGRILDADDAVGTLLVPRQTPVSNRKHWIAYGVPLRGKLRVDAGAADALTHKGSSLLAAGITGVSGHFAAGDCVGCIGEDGSEFARGLVAYDSADCEKIKGLASSRIEAALGYHIADEVIHRDDLVLLSDVSANG